MAKSRSEPIYDSNRENPGPIKAVITAYGAALGMLDQRVQNKAIRDSLAQAASLWIRVFLPLRFVDGPFVRKVLRYDSFVTARWEEAKERLVRENVPPALGPQPTPLVYTGEMRKAAIDGANAQARATANRQYVVIRIPTGHPLRPAFARVVRTVSDVEIHRIAKEVEAALLAFLSADFLASTMLPEKVQVPEPRPREHQIRRHIEKPGRRRKVA